MQIVYKKGMPVLFTERELERDYQGRGDDR